MIIAFLLVFLVTLSSLWLLCPVAERVGLMDKPDYRKQHCGQIPLVGGVAMLVGLTVASLAFIPPLSLHIVWFWSALLITLLGVVDDRVGLGVALRMGGQALAAILLMTGSGLFLENLGNLFGLGEVYIGMVGFWLTILAVLGAINAFNMIDGIDGLAGGTSLVAFIGLALLFGTTGNHYGLWLTGLLLAALLPYLLANLSLLPFGRKVFLGDAGSTLIGLSIVWLLILGSQGETHSFRPVTALWLVAVPLMDMAAVMLRRVRKGLSPFTGGRDHLHHILMRKGLSDRQVLWLTTLVSVLLAGVGLAGEWLQAPESLMCGLFLMLFAGYAHGLQRLSAA